MFVKHLEAKSLLVFYLCRIKAIFSTAFFEGNYKSWPPRRRPADWLVATSLVYFTID